MNAEKIIAYMRSKGYRISDAPGHLNIVYVEGVDEYGVPNGDKMDGWNDRRLLLHKTEEGIWQVLFNATATTEPGASATDSKAAKLRGGVARIAFGQYLGAWRIGLHKGNKEHPALIQINPVTVHRDKDGNGIRIGDSKYDGLFGINQHGCLGKIQFGLNKGNYIGKTPATVSTWSEGCLVGWHWPSHLRFMNFLEADPRVIANKKFEWDTTIINGDELHKFQYNTLNIF